ncbi:MAG: metallophosphoesterase [bacterium]
MRTGLEVVFLLIASLACNVGAKPNTGFTIAVLGDRTGGADDSVLSLVTEDIMLINPDMVISVGDHIEGYTHDSLVVKEQWDKVLLSLSRIGVPWHLTPGNHDIWDDMSRRIYKRRIGATDTAFTYKGWLFVIVDVSNIYSSKDLPQTKLSWIEKIMQKNRSQPKVVFYHKPFWAESFSKGESDTLHSIFKRYGVKGVFTGHYHCYFSHSRDGVQYFSVCSSGGSIPGWGLPQGLFYGHILARFEGDSLVVKPIEAGLRKRESQARFEDLLKLAEIEKSMIEINEVRIDSRMDSLSLPVSVTIHNKGASTLSDRVLWSFSKNWSVEPKFDYVEIPAGEEATVTFFAVSEGTIFPAPLLKVRMEWAGEYAVLEKSLKIRRVVKAPLTHLPPAIDGAMKVEEWEKGEAILKLYSTEVSFLSDTTFCKIMVDSSNIYLGFECRQIAEIRSYQKQRDGFAGYDDRVFVLFQVAPQEFFEIAVNPAGTIFDRKIEICPIGTYIIHPDWDCKGDVSTVIHSGGWIAEIAIPMSSLGVSHPSEIGFNMGRYQAERKRLEAFQFPYRYDSDFLGILLLDR